jgi:hypothetical protein
MFLSDPISTGPASSLSRNKRLAWPTKQGHATGACRLSLRFARHTFPAFRHSQLHRPRLCPPYGCASEHPRPSPSVQAPTFMDSFCAETNGESAGMVFALQKQLSILLAANTDDAPRPTSPQRPPSQPECSTSAVTHLSKSSVPTGGVF